MHNKRNLLSAGNCILLRTMCAICAVTVLECRHAEKVLLLVNLEEEEGESDNLETT